MELKEFVDDFNPNAILRVVEKDEVLYEGRIETLIQLLNCKVIKGSGTLVDGMTQIEVTECL